MDSSSSFPWLPELTMIPGTNNNLTRACNTSMETFETTAANERPIEHFKPETSLPFDNILLQVNKIQEVDVSSRFLSGVLKPQSARRPRKEAKMESSRRAKSPSGLQDHVLAERKRREKLSQRFIALSAIVPGLKKMDKSSVLAEAVKHIKQLEEQVKTYEEEAAERSCESVVFVNKSKLLVPEKRGNNNMLEAEVEARVYDKNVLLRIHCDKQNGVLAKALSEIENLNSLTIISTTVVPFGLALDITIIAQMEGEGFLEAEDLARTLCSAFQQFM